MTEKLEGRTVVVTGAAGGIGSALCSRFSDRGAKVIAIDRDATGLARLGHEVSLTGSLAVDLTDSEQTADALGGLSSVDVLVNNAGVTALGPADQIPIEAVEQVIEVNLLGSVNVTRAVLSALVEAKGRIGVLSSVAGFAPLVHRTAYSASKHALHGYFESLRVELADRGVSVTMVCPAFADTGIENRAVARSEGEAGEWSTTGRHLTADEIATRVVSGLEKRRRLVLPGATAKAAYWTWRYAPALFERLMRSRIAASSR